MASLQAELVPSRQAAVAAAAPRCQPALARQVTVCNAAHQRSTACVQPDQPAGLKRRGLLSSALLLAGTAVLPVPASRAADVAKGNAAAASSSTGSADELVAFVNPAQGYTLMRPISWEQVGKAGADSLFRDPAQKSTTVGVTVYPVTISSLEQFGDLQTVGERLLGAEREKESTLGVTMVAQVARTDPAGGFTIYDFEYELESTRGRKRVLSTVAIAGRKLYIANGNVSCGKASTCEAAEAVLPLVRATTQSLAVKV